MAKTNHELIREIFVACAELSGRLGRPISPDGHLVGSLGELYASDLLGLKLMSPSNHGFDALTHDGTPVEIKATTRDTIALSSEGSKADILVVVQFDRDGVGRLAYHGPISRAWEIAGKPQKNGQRRVSVRRLCQGDRAGQELP